MKIQTKILFHYRVLFLGSNNDKISQIFFQGLLKQKEISKLEVLTTSDRNKANCLYDQCKKNDIQLYQPFKNDVKLGWKEINLQMGKYDLGFVCSFGYMVPGFFFDKIEKMFCVVHPSMLPKYRGASPIQFALLKDEDETGVSYVNISKSKFDAGSIILQNKLKINKIDTYKSLSEKLINLASDQIPFLLQNIDELLKNSQIQNENQMSLAPKLNLEETYVDFQSMDSTKIYNLYRAFYGTNFSSIKCMFQDLRISFNKIEKVKLQSDK